MTHKSSHYSQGWFRRYCFWILNVAAVLAVTGMLVSLACTGHLTLAEAIQIGITAFLVLITINYAIFTKDMATEIKEQRMDASKPLLVPIKGRNGVAGLSTSAELLSAKKSLLSIRNIGSGPATNVCIRLESRAKGHPPQKGYLNETLTDVPPLGADSEQLAVQWKDENTLFQISDGQWLVISYDDLFGRHLETEGQWKAGVETWFYVKNREVEKPPSREDDSQNPGVCQ